MSEKSGYDGEAVVTDVVVSNVTASRESTIVDGEQTINEII
jgi:hypothetical protein